ncbi:MAG: class I SAM-dependent methyltransferase [Nitrospinota bacterium]|nr:class I SAM-dependent methyltransferase [Nitrospinota bacterium]
MPNFSLFIDPKTGAPLVPDGEAELVSRSGPTRYPIKDGIPRFVSEAFYAESGSADHGRDPEVQTGRSFGNKWRDGVMATYGSCSDFSKENLTEQFVAMLGCENVKELEYLLGSAERTLNGGCGTAWSEWMFNVNPKTERHCVDLSLAVESARNNTKHMPNVTVAQASVLELPYPDGLFDVAYSDGVVHHTPDPKKAVLELGRVVKSGGRLGIYIYNVKPLLREMADRTIRENTTKMSYQECLEFSKAMTKLGKAFKDSSASPLLIEKDIPLLGVKAGSYDLQRFIYDHLIKCWYNPGVSLEYADFVNLDWYHPAYASHHSEAEVRSWFSEAGFGDIKLLQPAGWEHSGFFISGVKR